MGYSSFYTRLRKARKQHGIDQIRDCVGTEHDVDTFLAVEKNMIHQYLR